MRRFYFCLCLIFFAELMFSSTSLAKPSDDLCVNDALTTAESLSAALMQYYCFSDYPENRDVHDLNFKEILGDYVAIYDGYSIVKTYISIQIWWPEGKELQYDPAYFLEKLVVPLLREPIHPTKESAALWELSREAYSSYLHLKGIKKPWHADLDAYSKILDDIRAKQLDDPITELERTQKVSFQDVYINRMIIKNIQDEYPDVAPPLGVHIKYWQDPWKWTMW